MHSRWLRTPFRVPAALSFSFDPFTHNGTYQLVTAPHWRCPPSELLSIPFFFFPLCSSQIAPRGPPTVIVADRFATKGNSAQRNRTLFFFSFSQVAGLQTLRWCRFAETRVMFARSADDLFSAACISMWPHRTGRRVCRSCSDSRIHACKSFVDSPGRPSFPSAQQILHISTNV